MDVRNYLIQHHMVNPGDLVIAAVSGGADSLCLLLVLEDLRDELGYKLEAVHVEHGIRGEESLADAHFVEKLCQERGIPLHIYSVDVPRYIAEHGGGLEEAARKLRYEAFAKAADEKGQEGYAQAVGEKEQEDYASPAGKNRQEDYAQAADEKGLEGYAPEQIKIALAHHMQDQAETVLFRLARGTGIAGLAGMEPVRRDGRGYTYIRPLLGTAREEIEAYLTGCGQTYCTDATNLDESYARNRIRGQVLPELSKVNAQAARHIAQTAELAVEQQDYIESIARQELAHIAWSTEQKSARVAGADRISVNIDKLSQLHPALQREMLRQALYEVAAHQKDLTSGHVQQLMELTQKTSGSRISLPYGVQAVREFDRLVIQKQPDERKSKEERSKKERSKKERNIEDGACYHDESQSAEDLQSEEPEQIVISPDQIQKWGESGEEVLLQLSGTEMMHIRFYACVAFSEAEGVRVIFRYQEPTTEENLSDFRKKSYTRSFNYDMIKGGFTIRRRRPGDYFYMKDGHRKKLKQYLIEEKIPASERQKLWLLTRDSQVLWVVGIRFPEV